MPAKTETLEHYLFVVDTNQYAGNFERDLCAYVTGYVDSLSGVGQEEADLAKKEAPDYVRRLEGLLKEVSYDEGFLSAVHIFSHPRYGNDGPGNHALLTEKNKKKFPHPAYFSVAMHFSQLPAAEDVEMMKERAKEFATGEKITIESFRLLEEWKVYREVKMGE